MSFLARWWPIPAGIALLVVVQQLTYSSRYDVGGHAAEHLGSGSFAFFAIAVVAVLLWTTPAARRSPLVLVGIAAWLGAGVAILVGNVRVVDALIDSGQARTSTDSLIGSSTIDDAHWLANNAPLLGVIAAMVIVAGLQRLGAISMRLAIICAVLNVVVPYWVIPGFGVAVAAVARCIARERSAARTEPPAIVVT